MKQPTTFREAYEVLQRHAQELRNADEPNIDDLLDVVTESVAAYKVCKQRIDAVELALKDALADVGADTGLVPTASSAGAVAPRSVARESRPALQANGMDDDVPF